MSAHCPCGQPTSGATICTDCRHTLEVALVNIAAYAADLPTVRAKLARYSDRGTGGREIPLPLDTRFTDPRHDHWRIEADTHNTLITWARIVLKQWPPLGALLLCDDPLCRRCQPLAGEAHQRRPPRNSVRSCCAYLQRMLPRITAAEYADELLDELCDLERRLQRIIDRPPDRWYAGKCSAPTADGHCDAELYACADNGAIRCHDCGTTHDIAARREFLLNEAEHMLVTASEAARAVVVWSDYGRGENRLVKRISTWRDRNRIEVRGHMAEMGVDRPLYRLGDVLDLLADDATRESRNVDKSA